MTDPVLTSPAESPAGPAPAVVPAVSPAVTARPAEEKQEVARVLLHMPVDVRSASLVMLAVLAAVFTLKWAAAVFIPMMVSLMATYALAPLVNFLERLRVPRWIGAAVILLGLGGAFGWTGYSLAGSASQLIDSLPVATQKLREAIRSKPSTNASPIESVQKAATQLEQAATDSSAKVAARRGVTRVTVERPEFNVHDYLLTGTVGLLNAAGQLTLMMFLTFFALGSGNTFRRKLVKITGPSLEKKKITVHVLDDITQHIQRYLLVQILTSALVGVTTALSFWGLGLENAAVWGIIAGIANLIPYIGSLAITGAAGLVAFLQFGNIQMALTIGGVSLLIHTLVGNLLVPYLTSRTSRMNALAVFVGVIFWGWLWGIWGLLLGIPITMVIKAVCDRVEDLQPLGELLGD
jgi:predicted PurR-regulated permease PerM